jgi:3-oxoacyl-[acyl-carrier protein] reductase
MVSSNRVPLEFEGKVVIITGAAKGIGKATAIAFGNRGATVVMVDILHKELENVCGIIQKTGADTLALHGDVADNNQVKKIIQKTLENFGKIDVLVNNAGIDPGSAPVVDITDEMWDKALAVNLKSVFYFCRGVVPVMKKTGKGCILNVASIAAKEPNENMAPYAVSKAGMICFSRVLAKEVARDNIRVNSIAPALTQTELIEALSQEQFRKLLEKIPMGRIAYPEEIAELILFLSSERSSYITGQCYNVSGGRGEY